jgi:hypothetical protein
MGGRVKKQR